jgi:hypothetical protein
VDRICFPDRREAVHGGCGKNFLFFTLRKTNIDPLAGRDYLTWGASFSASPVKRGSRNNKLGAPLPARDENEEPHCDENR